MMFSSSIGNIKNIVSGGNSLGGLIDPFAIARMKAENQASAASSAGPQAVDMMQMAPQANATTSPNEPTQAAPQQLVTGSTNTQRQQFQKSDITPMLQRFGIDNKNLAFNSIGRIQLLGRLRNKYGPQFNQNPEALDILSKFDQGINQFGDENSRGLTSMVSTSARTLASLLG